MNRLTALGLLLLLWACQEKKGLDQEYAQVQEASSRLRNSRMLVLDRDSSWVDWTLRHQSGAVLDGRFRPGKGSLVLEKENLVAGFLEGDFQTDNQLFPPADSTQKWGADSLIRRFPDLLSSRRSRFRLDISQANRLVPRSDFRQISGGTETPSTHQVQAFLDLADSTVQVSIPVSVAFEGKNVRVFGSYSFNFRDFGILVDPKQPTWQSPFDPIVPCRINWVFRPWKGPAASGNAAP